MSKLTDLEIAKAIREAKKSGIDVYLTDVAKARGVGRLRLRARPTGQCLFYFRYFDSSGKQDSLSLGVYDDRARDGLTLRAAREKAGEWSRLYQDGKRDLRTYLDHVTTEDRLQRERLARERAAAERQAASGSLRALLDAYAQYLAKQGKSSASQAGNLFKRNVFEAWPHLAAMRACDITLQDVSAILARLIEADTGRTAGKVRAYLRAAFALALQAESDPTVPAALHGFNLTGNPAALVPAKTLARYNIARERTLNATELRAYMAALDALPEGCNRDALKLCLYLGGQRPAQLLRVRPADVDMDAGEITLFDGKGARKQPRAHRLPLTARAAAIIEGLLPKMRNYVAAGQDGEQADKPYLLTNNGKVPVRAETISAIASEISKKMVNDKTAREVFGLRDIRRTCETMLAQMGVSKDIRAQILSHGLGGVQDRHYDRHDYMDEKRRALEAWAAKLLEIETGIASSNVVELQARQRLTV